MSYVKPIPLVASRFDIPKAQSEEIKESQTVWEWISEKMGDPDRGEGVFIAVTLAGS